MTQHGFWYSFGRACWDFFNGLDSVYNGINPNKIFIGIGFICFFWWIKWQADYNKKFLKSGGLK